MAMDISAVLILHTCFEVHWFIKIDFHRLNDAKDQRTVRDFLLICFQTLRGHYGSAISHVKNNFFDRRER